MFKILSMYFLLCVFVLVIRNEKSIIYLWFGSHKTVVSILRFLFHLKFRGDWHIYIFSTTLHMRGWHVFVNVNMWQWWQTEFSARDLNEEKVFLSELLTEGWHVRRFTFPEKATLGSHYQPALDLEKRTGGHKCARALQKAWTQFMDPCMCIGVFT